MLEQVGGTKFWWLLHPDALTEADGVKPDSSTPQNCYGINPFEGVGKGMKWLLAVVHPGSVMVVPPGWWHYMQSYDANLSVNTWYTEEEVASLDLGGPQDTARDGDDTVDLRSATQSPICQTKTIVAKSNGKTRTEPTTAHTPTRMLSPRPSPRTGGLNSKSRRVQKEGLFDTLQPSHACQSGASSETYSGRKHSHPGAGFLARIGH